MKKDAERRSFEKIYRDYQPLIYGVLKKYNIYRGQEDVLQEARLALWEAHLRFDQTKGHFAAYAKMYVYGRVKRYLQKQEGSRREVPDCSLSLKQREAFLDKRPDPKANQIQQKLLEQEQITEMSAGLKGREELIFHQHLLQQVPLREIALKEEIAYDTVKKWKKKTIGKLRKGISRQRDD